MAVSASTPPGWGDDELSKFLQAVRDNQHATFVNHKTWFNRLARIDAIFFTVASNIINPKNPVAVALFYRAHAAYRAACGTAMAGQATETFVLVRSCLEYAAYALHMAENPALTEIWLDRNQSSTDKKTMIAGFRDWRTTVGKHDQVLLKVLDDLYERTIDFGGHPNQYGVTGSLQIQEQPDRKLFLQVYLHGDGLQLVHALKTTAQAGICALRIFQFMMREKFELLGARAGIEREQQGL